MAHKVDKRNEKFNIRTRIDLGDGEYVALANNYRSTYSDGKDAYFLEIRDAHRGNIYMALDEQDMIELFKGFVEIAQWYKDKGFEVGI